MFSNFGEQKLERVDSSILTKITSSVFKSYEGSELPPEHWVYVLAICDIVLNPSSSGIKCNDKLVLKIVDFLMQSIKNKVTVTPRLLQELAEKENSEQSPEISSIIEESSDADDGNSSSYEELNSLVVSEQPQNDKEAIVKVLPEVMVSNIDLSNIVIDQRNNIDTKTSKEMKINAFLVKVNKKSIGDKIRKRRRKKKVQYKTIAKDSSPVTSDLTHCEEDFFMTSVKPITLLEQIIKELIPVTSKVVC
ncbi:hypothetical protein GLOIN_2v1771668 [Rhizophagus irregularis DAOM 181602=DAOM 197198]|nr:hypothetical protein GLOIN_2v1771668 [Rhizophagus irregularis DAOM 181602=DAOM 197198]